MTKATPLVKWVGGKRQLMPELLARVPSSFATYHEPFLGGGALFFALRPQRAVLSDINQEIVTTYQAVRDNPQVVIDLLQELVLGHCEVQFYSVRDRRYTDPAEVAARMIYLNKTCFNGLYRVNASGKFNVPIGKFKTPPTICDVANLRACSEALQGAELIQADFRTALLRPNRGDFVYCDPPYIPLSATSSFTSYSAGGFGPEDQRCLASMARELATCGVHVLLSNSSAPAVFELYQGMKVEKVAARRNVNCKGESRGEISEVLISA